MKKDKFVNLLIIFTAFLILIIATCTQPIQGVTEDPPKKDTTAPEAPFVNGVAITNSTLPTWTWDLPDTTVKFRYQLDSEVNEWNEVNSSIQEYTPLTELTEGNHILYVQAADNAGNWSLSGSFTTKIDLSATEAPVVTVTAITNDRTPTWTWTTPDGAVNIRYKLDDGDWIEIGNTSTASYTPISSLSEERHVLEVQALDNAGNWSLSGSAAVLIDITPPDSPTVNGATPTNNRRPTWNWNIPVETNLFRYRLDPNILWEEVEIAITDYTPTYNLSQGNHTLYVQSKDSAGNWSESGSHTIEIDLSAPEPPTVSSDALTNDSTPTWTWNIPDDTANFQYRLDSASWIFISGTSTTLFTPSIGLSDGDHTFEVQAQNSLGTWSASGIRTITIDTLPPDSPVVNSDSNTDNLRPTWTWTTPDDAEKFRYKLNNDSWTTTSDIATTSFTPSEDLDFGSHTLYVEAQDMAGNWSETAESTTVIDLDAPTNLRGYNITSNKVDLYWTDNSNSEDGFIVERKIGESGIFEELTRVSKNAYRYIDTSLIGGQQYYFRVKAYNTKGESSYTNVLDIFTVMEIPGFTSSNVSSTHVTLNWNPVDTADGYNLYRSSIYNGSYVKITSDGELTGTTYTDNNVTPATRYYYKITSYNSYGESEQSNYWSTPTNFQAPVGINVNITLRDEIRLKWLTDSNPAAHFEVYRSNTIDGNYELVAETGDIKNISVVGGEAYRLFEDKNLTTNTTYYYKVKMYEYPFGGDLSEPIEASTKINESLSPPEFFRIDATYASRVHIDWNDVAEADGFVLYYSNYSSGPFEKILCSYPGDGYVRVVSNLSSETTYYFKISSYNADGESETTSLISTTTGSLPTAPSGLKITGITSNSVTLSWNSVSGATSYSVYRAYGEYYPSNHAGTTTNTSITVTFNASANVRYQYAVRTNANNYDQSVNSNYVLAIVPPSEGAQNFICTSKTSSTAYLSWDEVPGTVQYEIYKSTSFDGTYNLIGGTSAGTTYPVNYLVPGTTYYFKLEPCDNMLNPISRPSYIKVEM